MLNLALKLIGFIPAPYRAMSAVFLVIAAIGGLFGFYAWGHADGYHLADVEWAAKYQKREIELQQQTADELARQQAANDAAKAEEDAQQEAERKRQMAAVDLAMTLAAEAAADPNRDNIAFDADAVDRHNRSIQ